MKPDSFRQLPVLVLGGGISGNSAAKLLHNYGAKIYLCDKNRPETIADSYIAFKKDDISPPQILDGIQLIIKSPGISPEHAILAYARGKLPILSEVDLARIFYQGKLIGITGTDGKSTTTALVQHLLSDSFQVAMGGNIGIPFSSLCTEHYDWIVLELSSYQLEDSENLNADLVAILNFAPDHLERHVTLENYINAKKRILNNSGKQILVTSERTIPLLGLNQYNGKVMITCTGNCEAQIDYPSQTIKTSNFLYQTNLFRLQGYHNIENLATAILLAESAGASSNSIQRQISTFKGLHHRFELVHKTKRTEFINDSKATNLHSLTSWLINYPQNKNLVLLLGGKNKETNLTHLASILKNLHVNVFLFGEARKEWKEQLQFLGEQLHIKDNLDEIFLSLQKTGILADTDQVVLSPGCASFDQYRNFEERGEHFVRLAKNIKP